MTADRRFPYALQELHNLEFDYADGEGIDFEPYQEFVALEEVQHWFRAWTGNPNANGDEYLIFGQDGTGGYAAIWPTRVDKELLEQPIVFFGSEGELGIVASNFSDYLWVLQVVTGHTKLLHIPMMTGPAIQRLRSLRSNVQLLRKKR